jgi:hypothetical protein
MWREYQREREHRPMRLTAPTLQAPADRIDGRRGWRGTLAVAAVLGALATFVLSQAVATGTGSHGRNAWDFTSDGPSWTGPTLVAATIALLAVALLLCVARSPALLVLAFALAALAVVGALVAHGERQDAGRVTRAQVRALELGTSHGDVTATLGTPSGHGTMRLPGERLDCLMYRNPDSSGPTDFALCFRNGRLAVREVL